MRLCDRCQVSGCYLDYLGEACVKARGRDCPGLHPDRAEVIGVMDTDQLAQFLSEVKSGLLDNVSDIKAWLLEETEE